MLNSKRGSVIVFICIFFTSLMLLIQAFISAGKAQAVSSATESLESLWVQSIMAEYDLNLLNIYGLNGFYGRTRDIEEKIRFYANESFGEKKYVNIDDCICRLYDYSLANTKIAKKQIVAAGKETLAREFTGNNISTEIVKVPEGALMIKGQENAFDDLPSDGNSQAVSVSTVKTLFQGMSSLGDIIDTQSDRFFINKYIYDHLNSKSESDKLDDSYLKYEVEYLICAKHTDEANLSGVRKRIIGMRQVSNMAFLNTDSSRSKAIMAVAEVIAPEAPLLSYEAIIAAWSLAESVNDYNLLINGHKVPIVKTDKSWATDLDDVLENIDNDCIYTENDSGLSYNDYLSLLTYTMDEKVLLLRILDVIQLNMRHLYYDSFRIKKYNGGMELVLTVNSKNHVYSKSY